MHYRRGVAVLGILLLAGLAASVVPASASARRPGRDASVTAPFLVSQIAASSARNAWAVGAPLDPRRGAAFTLRWNGKTWKQVPIPKPGQDEQLRGVAVRTVADAWAVGQSGVAYHFRPVILRWNGTSWTRVASPNPSSNCEVADVAATSATNAWAVGDCIVDGDVDVAMVLHWNGHAWKKAPTPLEDQPLSSVTAPAAGEVWVAGEQGIWRWTGRAWQ